MCRNLLRAWACGNEHLLCAFQLVSNTPRRRGPRPLPPFKILRNCCPQCICKCCGDCLRAACHQKGEKEKSSSGQLAVSPPKEKKSTENRAELIRSCSTQKHSRQRGAFVMHGVCSKYWKYSLKC